MTECTKEYVLVNNSQCVFKCTKEYSYLEHCEENCPTGLYEELDGQKICVTKCPEDYYEEEIAGSGSKKCVEGCYQFVEDSNQCVGKCSSGLYVEEFSEKHGIPIRYC